MKNIESIYRASCVQMEMFLQGTAMSRSRLARHQLPKGVIPSSLQSAWSRILADEPLLRSSFVYHNLDWPVQAVHKMTPSPGRFWLDSILDPPWQIETANLVRCGLIKRNDSDLDLVIQAAPILLDSLSTWLLLDRVIEAALSGSPACPSDSLRESSSWFSGRNLETAQSFWKSTFQSWIPKRLPLMGNGSQQHKQRHTIRLSRASADAILHAEQLFGVSSETAFLATCAIFVARLSDSQETTIGVQVSGRPFGSGNKLLGCFEHVLPLRACLSGSRTLSAFVKRMSALYVEMLKHQYCSMAQVTEWLGESVITDVIAGIIDQNCRTISPQKTYPSLLELYLHLKPRPELEIFYEPEMGRKIAVQAARFIERALLASARQPEQPLFGVDLLEDKAEATAWRVSGSEGSPAKESAHSDVTKTIAAAAAKFRDLPALVSSQKALTYQAFNNKTNQLARYLRSQGACGESIVALLLEDPVNRIMATIGVMKAGAAYLPIDAKLPFERISYMLDNSQAQLIITTRQLSGRLPSSNALIVDLDSDAELIEAESAESVPAEWVDPQFIAYVIYTSGSTGTPKGVAVRHDGLMNLVSALIRRLGLRPGVRGFHFASASFDTSVWEILPPLCSGATLCVAETEDMLPGAPLMKTLRDMKISHAIFVPSVLAVLDPETLPDLHTVTTAGEPCSTELVGAWARPGKKFWNAYGPTECTVCASLALLKAKNPVHIGWPMDGAQLYVLDDHLGPVPQGTAGQLFIGGKGVARGYWRASSMTASRFLPDPFSKDPGARMYSTGDRVVRRGGLLEFLGRSDRQIKLRGFRIEPGEIEAALLAHPVVKQAAVIAREENGAARLIAYIVCSEGERRTLDCLPQERETERSLPVASLLGQHVSIDGTRLKEHLGKTLPLYMVPTEFVFLPLLPVTNNGKIDYAALPPPHTPAECAPPETEIEKTLYNIWRRVLPEGEFGIHDNFFDAGGNSILAAEVHIYLCRALSRDISLIDILKYPTIHSLGAQLAVIPEQKTPAPDEIGKRDRHSLLLQADRRRAI